MYMAQLSCKNGFKKWNKKMLPIVVYSVAMLCICASTSNIICSYSSSANKRMVLSDLQANEDYLQQNSDRNKIWKLVGSNIGARRRLLGGPGSAPPRCTQRCGRCVPCRPILVTVPSETPVTTEYYPQAWMCECGNRLYIP